MAYLVLIGSGGWMQRWEIAVGEEPAVAESLHRIGKPEIGALPLVDPNSGDQVTFLVTWQAVAAAYITPSPERSSSPGQYS